MWERRNLSNLSSSVHSKHSISIESRSRTPFGPHATVHSFASCQCPEIVVTSFWNGLPSFSITAGVDELSGGGRFHTGKFDARSDVRR